MPGPDWPQTVDEVMRNRLGADITRQIVNHRIPVRISREGGVAKKGRAGVMNDEIGCQQPGLGPGYRPTRYDPGIGAIVDRQGGQRGVGLGWRRRVCARQQAPQRFGQGLG